MSDYFVSDNAEVILRIMREDGFNDADAFQKKVLEKMEMYPYHEALKELENREFVEYFRSFDKLGWIRFTKKGENYIDTLDEKRSKYNMLSMIKKVCLGAIGLFAIYVSVMRFVLVMSK